MARRSRRNNRRMPSPRRDPLVIATGSPVSRVPGTFTWSGPDLRIVEDFRTFSSNPIRRAAASSRRPFHELVVSSRSSVAKRPASVPVRVAFRAARTVAVCIRRSRRRRVLFATGGAFKKRKRAPRSSYFSSVSCGGR